jgi:REP element-mobilizing transposase RayT
MARGIEKREIYRDRIDRQAFLERLSEIIIEGQAKLYAWALMPNHFHLLLRPQEASMVDIMRRLMTGYSVWHNKRHKRSGHLFQNRYKSIVVEEEPYFLELVRYIHLNPIRGKLLVDMSQLDSNPYTGHAVILGKNRYECQDADWVLNWFGLQVGPARRKYRAFVKAGFKQGVREELRGGGLIRSSGGREKFVARSREDREKGDERILGNGSFVEFTLKKCQKRQPRKTASVDSILAEVCRSSRISMELILSGSRVRPVSTARRLFLLRAYEEAGASYARLGRICGLAHTSVKQAIEKARTETEMTDN